MLAELVEQQMETVIAPYLEGLNAVLMVESGGDWVAHPDWSTRLKAAETLLDRTSGKPRQAVDQTIEAGESLRELLAPTPLGSTDTVLEEGLDA